MKQTLTPRFWIKVGHISKSIITQPTWATLILVGFISSGCTTLPPASNAQASGVQVAAYVDTEYCISPGRQCTVDGTGHTNEAATDANRNPIRMFVSVTKDGEEIPGLTAENFSFGTWYSPAAGKKVVFCSIANCGTDTFQDDSSTQGLYSLMLDVGAPGNWVAGTYANNVSVLYVKDNSQEKGIGFVTFKIPAHAP